ncbi:hypothetical protein RHGRI_019792 [Rhododendron griersonianum]|uniref:AP2/ERF domain-containing protein n=1 Tax=Rhododendron griersonianum TaxID=479676 RepID=A0AAV6JHU4_9ERIC|nr:hypothetical protein RHGRI_019792 [Rhododendron griersonianum]
MKTNSTDPLSAAKAGGGVGGGSGGGGADAKIEAGAPPQLPAWNCGGGEGMRRRKKTSSRGHPRFVGVRQRRSGKWVAEIKDSVKNVRLWLGTFDTVEDAARAYDKAARAIRGVNARTNFELPESASESGRDGSDSCVPENAEPFSFEELCGAEEPDGLLGALRAKLLDGKTVSRVVSPQQENSSSGESSNGADNNNNNNSVFGSTRELSSITSPSAPYEVPLVTLDSSSGIIGVLDHNQLASNNTSEAKTFNLFWLDHDRNHLVETESTTDDKTAMQWQNYNHTGYSNTTTMWPGEPTHEEVRATWGSQTNRNVDHIHPEEDRGLFGTIGSTWPGTTHEATVHTSCSSNCWGEQSIPKNGIVEEDMGNYMPVPASRVSGTCEWFWPSDQQILDCGSMSWENDDSLLGFSRLCDISSVLRSQST